MPTVTVGDEYERMLGILEDGKLPATIQATYQGQDGLWTRAFALDPRIDLTDPDMALYAAYIAIRSTYRSAHKSGALPRYLP